MKTQINRTELEKIFKIACETWKPRIEKYAQRTPFSQTINFTEKEIQEMVKACLPEQLPIVKDVFEITTSWENIKSLEDAIKYLRKKDDEVKILNQLNECSLPRHIIAEQELVVITKALNEKQELDWDDYNEYKYYLWWYLGKNFRLRCVACSYASSYCSARLCFVSKDRAEHASKYFKNIYKDYITK